jgi:hypothetical protein
MANTFFRQFLFHLKWSLWVLLVTAAALAGTWWLLAHQNWFGVKPLPWLNLNMVILLIATAVFIPLTMLLRSHETRDLLQKCILFSILLHVAITMLLSGISVSRDVIHHVRIQSPMEVPINLEASRAAELQLAVRNQITNLPVATPQAGGDAPPQSAIEVNIEPPRPIQNEPPRTIAKPAPVSFSPEAAPPPAPRPAEQVALAIPQTPAPIPQLEIPLPKMQQSEASSPPPPPIASSRMQLPFVAAAPQPLTTGNLPLTQSGGSLASELPLMREGTPHAEPLDIRPRVDIVQLPQITIPTLPVAPITGAEVQTNVPAPQSPRIASTTGKPGPISTGVDSSLNPVGSTSILEQPIASKVPQSFGQAPSPDPFPIPQLDIKLPSSTSSVGSSDTAISPDFVEPPRPTTSLASSSTGTAGSAPIKATNLPPPTTIFDQWAPQPPAQVAVKFPDPIPEPLPPKVVTPLPDNIGPKQMPAPDTLVQRSEEIRQPLAETFGGSKATEDAVARALDYLSRNQEADGRWTRFTSDRSPRRRRNDPRDVALTGLATLAFLASDFTPNKESLYQDNVRLGLNFLIEEQRGDGSFRGGGGDMYDQAIAIIALSEAAIMTRDPLYQKAAFKGADYLLRAHHKRSGGWRYQPNQQADTSVTGWCVMALHSAEQAGFAVPPGYRGDILRYLNSVSSGPNRALVGYQDPRKPGETMTAQATFTRILLGQQPTSAQIEEASRFATRFSPAEWGKDFYHWYYVSLMLMQVQNESWKTWNKEVSQTLLSLQRGDGHANGSWDSDGLRNDPGGRIFSTAMATLTLEVYYRYLPMYSKRN